MIKNIIKFIILIIIIIIINITDFLSGKSYRNNYNNINNRMFSLEKERNINHKSIMNNSLIIENQPMEIVKKKPVINNNFHINRIDRNHHIKKKEYIDHHVNKIKISLKKRIYNFFYKRKNDALIKLFFLKKTKFIIINHPMINISDLSEAEYLFKKKLLNIYYIIIYHNNEFKKI